MSNAGKLKISNSENKTSGNRKIVKAAIISAVTISIIAICYLVGVYSNIGFIKNLRTLYIETAMSTMTHQWLATAFIPDDVIQEVLDERDKQFKENIVESSLALSDTNVSLSLAKPTITKTAKQKFAELFPEVNIDTMPADTDYENVNISDIESLGIKTNQGDTIWGIDQKNKILIISVSGNSYKGKLALVKDSSKVYLHNNTRANRGSTVTEHCEDGNGILGINASGFIDYNGTGSGKTPVGLIVSNGEQLNKSTTYSNYQVAGYDENNNLMVGRDLDISKLRDAMQFYPIIVLNGEKHATGSYGLGVQPRSVIGQSKDGSTMFLIIDGRKPGYSLGATVAQCADILLRYDCFNAMNMDGGSSASMSYNGKMITRTSSPMVQGRYVPDAWIVKAEQEVESESTDTEIKQ